MTKFFANDPLTIRLDLPTGRVFVPGIAVADSFIGTRTDRDGNKVPSEWVQAITFHHHEATPTSPERIYYKMQRQAAFFSEPRIEHVAEIDDLDAETLIAKVAESREEFLARISADRAEKRDSAPKPKADFTQLTLAVSK